jgi:hypothetical protein
MKKVFLLFGIAVFSSASAQQKDLFDIGIHLQKKQAESKKAAEKKNMLLPPRNIFNLYIPYTANQSDLSYLLPNGDKVIILGQDNMPCVVPDMSQFQNMPNPSFQRSNSSFVPFTKGPGQIPNGALPFSMIVWK